MNQKLNDKSSVLYDRSSGYYILPKEENFISFPWDDDTFTLCLDAFPSIHVFGKDWFKPPLTSSPLRNQWGTSTLSSSSEEAFAQSITLPGVDEERREEPWLLLGEHSSDGSRTTLSSQTEGIQTPSDEVLVSASVQKKLNQMFPYSNSLYDLPLDLNKVVQDASVQKETSHPTDCQAQSMCRSPDSYFTLRDNHGASDVSFQPIDHSSTQMPSHSYGSSTSYCLSSSSYLPSIASVSTFDMSPHLKPNSTVDQERGWKIAKKTPSPFKSILSTAAPPPSSSYEHLPLPPPPSMLPSSTGCGHYCQSCYTHQNLSTSEEEEYRVQPKGSQEAIAFKRNAEKLILFSRRSSVGSLDRSSFVRPKTYSDYFNPDKSLSRHKTKQREAIHQEKPNVVSRFLCCLKQRFSKKA